MISKVHIKNIQSCQDLTLLFDPGINIITGISDAGKSTTMRSIIWAARNEMPTSWDRFQRHDTKESSVTINDLVTRLRSASKNLYNVKGFKKPFKSLGKSVPDEVQNILKLSDENFQEQHDAYFLIEDNPGQVARTLNKVAELQIIDLSRQSVKQKIREAKGNAVFLKEELKEQREKIKNLSWVESADKDYSLVEEKQKEADSIQTENLSDQIQLIESLKEEIKKIPSTTEDRVKLLQAQDSIDVDLSLEHLIKTAEDNQVSIPEVKPDILKIFKSINALDISFWEFEALVQEIEDADQDLQRYPSIIDDPTQHIEELSTLSSQLSPVEEAINELLIAEDVKDHAEQSYRDKKADIENAFKNAEICPLCGGSTCDVHMGGQT